MDLLLVFFLLPVALMEQLRPFHPGVAPGVGQERGKGALNRLGQCNDGLHRFRSLLCVFASV
jgi:hypothetical protein